MQAVLVELHRNENAASGCIAACLEQRPQAADIVSIGFHLSSLTFIKFMLIPPRCSERCEVP